MDSGSRTEYTGLRYVPVGITGDTVHTVPLYASKQSSNQQGQRSGNGSGSRSSHSSGQSNHSNGQNNGGDAHSVPGPVKANTKLAATAGSARLAKLQERRDPDGISEQPIDVLLRTKSAGPTDLILRALRGGGRAVARRPGGTVGAAGSAAGNTTRDASPLLEPIRSARKKLQDELFGEAGTLEGMAARGVTPAAHKARNAGFLPTPLRAMLANRPAVRAAESPGLPGVVPPEMRAQLRRELLRNIGRGANIRRGAAGGAAVAGGAGVGAVMATPGSSTVATPTAAAPKTTPAVTPPTQTPPATPTAAAPKTTPAATPATPMPPATPTAAGPISRDTLLNKAKSMQLNPWVYPAAGAGLLAGGYGLYSLLNRSRGDEREKESSEIGQASRAEKFVGDTVGRVGNILGGGPLITTDLLRDPTKGDRENEHANTLALMESARPQQLGDVKLRLGGSNMLDDLKRVWTNKRTGPLGKVLGTAVTPVSSLAAMIGRGPHYNPWSNTVVQTSHSQPITEHELGHAIDFNDRPLPKNWLSRQIQNTGRDLYGLAGGLPFVNLWHEMQANHKSHKALRDALSDNPEELSQREDARTRVLPAAYSTHLAPYLVANPLAALGGTAATKGVSTLVADREQRQRRERERDKQRDKREKESSGPYMPPLQSAIRTMGSRMFGTNSGVSAVSSSPGRSMSTSGGGSSSVGGGGSMSSGGGSASRSMKSSADSIYVNAFPEDSFVAGFVRECLDRGLDDGSIHALACKSASLSDTIATELEPLTKQAWIPAAAMAAGKALFGRVAPMAGRAASGIGRAAASPAGQAVKRVATSPLARNTAIGAGAGGTVGAGVDLYQGDNPFSLGSRATRYGLGGAVAGAGYTGGAKALQTPFGQGVLDTGRSALQAGRAGAAYGNRAMGGIPGRVLQTPVARDAGLGAGIGAGLDVLHGENPFQLDSNATRFGLGGAVFGAGRMGTRAVGNTSWWKNTVAPSRIGQSVSQFGQSVPGRAANLAGVTAGMVGANRLADAAVDATGIPRVNEAKRLAQGGDYSQAMDMLGIDGEQQQQIVAGMQDEAVQQMLQDPEAQSKALTAFASQSPEVAKGFANMGLIDPETGMVDPAKTRDALAKLGEGGGASAWLRSNNMGWAANLLDSFMSMGPAGQILSAAGIVGLLGGLFSQNSGMGLLGAGALALGATGLGDQLMQGMTSGTTDSAKPPSARPTQQAAPQANQAGGSPAAAPANTPAASTEQVATGDASVANFDVDTAMGDMLTSVQQVMPDVTMDEIAGLMTALGDNAYQLLGLPPEQLAATIRAVREQSGG